MDRAYRECFSQLGKFQLPKMPIKNSSEKDDLGMLVSTKFEELIGASTYLYKDGNMQTG